MRLYEDHCELVADFWAVLESGIRNGVPANELVGETINFFHRVQRGTVPWERIDDYYRVVYGLRKRYGKWAEGRRQQGLCVRCGKPVAKDGGRICPKCLALLREHNALRQLTPEQRASAIAQEEKGEAMMACS